MCPWILTHLNPFMKPHVPVGFPSSWAEWHSRDNAGCPLSFMILQHFHRIFRKWGFFLSPAPRNVRGWENPPLKTKPNWTKKVLLEKNLKMNRSLALPEDFKDQNKARQKAFHLCTFLLTGCITWATKSMWAAGMELFRGWNAADPGYSLCFCTVT